MSATFKVDRREFDKTLRTYREYSKRDPATICNTKAFYITRRAVFETPKADAAKIKNELGRIIGGKGKNAGKLILKAGRSGAPLVALIIQAKRKAEGLPSLFKGVSRATGAALMEKAVRAFIAGRMRSIAFLKSGWIPAIKALEPLAERPRGLPRMDRTAKQLGKPKGYAKPATGGWITRTIIANTAGANKNNRGALITYGAPALQRAFDAEERSMRDYIEKKQRETAKRAGVRTN